MYSRCALALVALVASAPAAPVVAANACDIHTTARAPRGARPTGTRAPYIIGDSTMILAAPYLGRMGVEADARGCRPFSVGVQMLAARRRHGSLPNVVVLALGANSGVDDGEIARALGTIGGSRILGLVTPRNSASSAAAMRRIARRLPQQVLLIDWVAFSAAHGSWFGGDGLHVSDTGARAFAGLIGRRLDPFLGPPRALRVPTGSEGAKACGELPRAGRRLGVLAIRGGDRVACSRARALVRHGTLRRIPGWRAYDFQHSGQGPWTDIYVRRDRGIIVAARNQPAPSPP